MMVAANVGDLVQRQASILAEIDNLSREELESFANSPLPKDAVSSEIKKARKLLRGLLRTRNVGSNDLKITERGTDNPGIVASPPGFFVIDLLPLPEGGFDRGQVMKTPLVAWEIDSEGYATPVVPCSPMTDRWAVLMPTGFVVVDEWTRLGWGPQIPLMDWLKNEIDWVDPETGAFNFWTASEIAFERSGPLPRAIWFMMAGRRDWTGTPEELLGALSKFREHSHVTGWPSRSTALAQALKELEPILAGVGLIVTRNDEGRFLIHRQSDESAGGGSSSSSLQ
jgi:hypothetical protein